MGGRQTLRRPGDASAGPAPAVYLPARLCAPTTHAGLRGSQLHACVFPFTEQDAGRICSLPSLWGGNTAPALWMRNRGSVCRDQPVSHLIQLEPGSVYTVLNVLLPW